MVCSRTCASLLIAALLAGCATRPPAGDAPPPDAPPVAGRDAAPAAPGTPGAPPPPSPEELLAREIEPDFRAALEAFRSGRLDEAERAFARLAERAPDFFGPQANLGLVLSARKDWARAEAALRRALELRPESAEVWNELGVIARAQGRFPDAQSAYEKAVALRPDWSVAHFNLAVLCDLYLRNYDCAVEHYQRYRDTAAAPDARIEAWIADVQRRARE